MIDTLNHPALQQLGWTLLHFVWQAAVLAIAAAALLSLIRAQSPVTRYWVSVATLMIMAACPVMTWLYLTATDPIALPTVASQPHPSGPSSQSLPVPEPPASEFTSSQTPTAPNIDAFTDHSVASAPQGTLAGWRDRLDHSLSRGLPWLAVAWTFGALVMSIRLVIHWLAVRRMRRQTSPITEPAIHRQLHQMMQKLGIRKHVQLVQSKLAPVPGVVGVLRPVILLPAQLLTGLQARELEAMLAHELAHIRRHDYLVNLIQTMVETLLFYHPAVWWISRQIRCQRELCCDDIAVHLVGDRLLYAHALTHTAAIGSGVRLVPSATGGDLQHRIQRLVRNTPASRYPGDWLVGISVLTLLLCCSAGVALARHAAMSTNDSSENQNEVADQENEAIIEPLTEAQESNARAETRQAMHARRNLQQQMNDAALKAHADQLKTITKGTWAVIVDGKIKTELESLEHALAVADQIDADALHRYIFRPGIDDRPVEFMLSPWIDPPNWVQLGRRFHAAAETTIAAVGPTWIRGDKRVDWGQEAALRAAIDAIPRNSGSVRNENVKLDPRPRIRIVSVGATGKDEVLTPTVQSGLFDDDLTLTEAIAQKLDLDLYSVPGTAKLKGWDAVCRKVLCRVRVPELDIDLPVVGYVIPAEVTQPRQPEATSSNQGGSPDPQKRAKEGLELHFHAQPADDDSSYEFRLDLTNVSSKPINLRTAFWYDRADESFGTYLQRYVTFTSNPTIMPMPTSRRAPNRQADQLTETLKPGHSLSVTWPVTTNYRQGYFLGQRDTIELLRPGVYKLRAKLLVPLANGREVELVSNAQSFQVGDSQQPAAASTAIITQCDQRKDTIMLNVGSAHGISEGDTFQFLPSVNSHWWSLEVIKVNQNSSITRATAHLRQGYQGPAPFPTVGARVSYRQER